MVSTYPTTQFVLHSVERNGVQKELLSKPQNGGKRCFLSFWRFKVQFRHSKTPLPFYLSVLIRFCWKKWRSKSVLGWTTKGGKLLLCVDLWRFNVQFHQPTAPFPFCLSVHSPFSFVGQNAWAVSLQSFNSHLKNLLQNLFKLNLQCVMLLTEKPWTFSWSAITVRVF